MQGTSTHIKQMCLMMAARGSKHSVPTHSADKCTVKLWMIIQITQSYNITKECNRKWQKT
jgi:hypothetical protein